MQYPIHGRLLVKEPLYLGLYKLSGLHQTYETNEKGKNNLDFRIKFRLYCKELQEIVRFTREETFFFKKDEGEMTY